MACSVAILLAFAMPTTTVAQDKPTPPPRPRLGAGLTGQLIFEQHCASCHQNAANNKDRTPSLPTLMKFLPERVYSALTTGVMKGQGQELTDTEKRLLAEFLGGRQLGSAQAGDGAKMPNQCASKSSMDSSASGPAWNGWGADTANTRFQPANAAGITGDQVPSLKLKWAFGFPNGTEAYGQPTIVSGRVFVGSDNGYVYSLDAESGCVYWSFAAQAGVRTAISVGPLKIRQPIYFGDLRANVYAVDASTGHLLWKTKVDSSPLGKITGAPTLHEGRLYVPVTSSEEVTAINPTYPCCTFRGSVVALDAKTGKTIWKTYAIAATPKPRKKNSVGTQLWAPAGAGIWSAPTIDAKRHVLYVGTGDAYTEPAAATSDSILALDLDTGKLIWTYQDIKNDVWLAGCGTGRSSDNCPEHVGPDWDFGSSPILQTLTDGRQIIVGAHKGGSVIALDPDKKGALLWRKDLFETVPTARGQIIFGGASDGENGYYALNSGGIAALRLTDGQKIWFTPLEPADTPDKNPHPGGSAAVTSIPGVIFAGGWDGQLRALSTQDGKVIWQSNTAQSFTTVNGVKASGGSMGAPGPTVAGGMLFVGSGYIGIANGMPGNVLLAFSTR